MIALGAVVIGFLVVQVMMIFTLVRLEKVIQDLKTGVR